MTSRPPVFFAALPNDAANSFCKLYGLIKNLGPAAPP
jgi:hypothetical protein